MHTRVSENTLLFCTAINYIILYERSRRQVTPPESYQADVIGKSAAVTAFETSTASAVNEEDMTVKSITNWFGAWKRYRTAVRELAQLSDRELADLGIARSEIDMVARQSAGI